MQLELHCPRRNRIAPNSMPRNGAKQEITAESGYLKELKEK
jgi:hypothetical protein